MSGSHSQAPAYRGMTLIELLIVVALIGLLTLIAMPAFQKAVRRSRITKFAKDVRVIDGAFQLYALENGGYPTTTARGIVPEGMGEYLQKVDWSQPTSLGGYWQFVVNRGNLRAGLLITGITASQDDLRELDGMIDDGNLASGSFREDDGSYLYEIQPAETGNSGTVNDVK
jgi:prepilin-type N-terminal cleavage/methylation domain-containing protein